MFYIDHNTYEGEPLRLYRRPAEIREDIIEIKERIDSAAQMLNIRNLISEALDDGVCDDRGAWICQLNELLRAAEEALAELKELKASLEGLFSELEDTLWVLGT